MAVSQPLELPADARYRPIRRGVVLEVDRMLQDTTPVTVPRGLLEALCSRSFFHAETPLARPANPGTCMTCDLLELLRQHTQENA